MTKRREKKRSGDETREGRDGERRGQEKAGRRGSLEWGSTQRRERGVASDSGSRRLGPKTAARICICQAALSGGEARENECLVWLRALTAQERREACGTHSVGCDWLL